MAGATSIVPYNVPKTAKNAPTKYKYLNAGKIGVRNCVCSVSKSVPAGICCCGRRIKAPSEVNTAVKINTATKLAMLSTK